MLDHKNTSPKLNPAIAFPSTSLQRWNLSRLLSGLLLAAATAVASIAGGASGATIGTSVRGATVAVVVVRAAARVRVVVGAVTGRSAT